jgi:hypothetical protein
MRIDCGARLAALVLVQHMHVGESPSATAVLVCRTQSVDWQIETEVGLKHLLMYRWETR